MTETAGRKTHLRGLSAERYGASCPGTEPPSPPAPMRAILRLRAVRDLPARIMAFGIWSVHVDR